MRINRYLAACGLASRRKSEAMVLAGRIQVNGQVVRDLSYRVKEGDRVTFDGRSIRKMAPRTYLFHKPAGCMVSHQDPHCDRLIYRYFPRDEGLFACGRLDVESEGLLLVTNQGSLDQALTHPAQKVEKEYWVILNCPLQKADRQRLLQGIVTRYDSYRADRIEFLQGSPLSVIRDWPSSPVLKDRLLSICLHEGKKRELRRMLQALGYRVLRLVRVRIGQLRLNGIEPGTYRAPNAQEEAYLRSLKGKRH